MNRPLKFKRDQKLFFVSDLHLGHERDFLLNPRWDVLPQETKDRLHNEFSNEVWNAAQFQKWVLEEWHKNVDEDTTVINLGDVCFNDAKGELFENVTKLHCADHFVLWGNHNSGMKQVYKKAKTSIFNLAGNFQQDVIDRTELYPLNHNHVTFVGRELTIMVGKKEIHLSHFGKRIWDHMSKGSWNLHGHSHGSDIERNVDFEFDKALDIGVENAIKDTGTIGFTFEQLEDIMSRKKVRVFDHHNGSENPS